MKKCVIETNSMGTFQKTKDDEKVKQGAMNVEDSGRYRNMLAL